MLAQKELIVPTRIIVKLPNYFVATLLVKLWRLKAVRGQQRLDAAARHGFTLCRAQQIRAIALSAQMLVHPQVFDVQAAAPRPAIQTRDDLPMRVVLEHG